jgi:hypothetical protein
VLGHEYKSPKPEGLFLACFLDRLGKPLAATLGAQELITPIDGEGQLVGVARGY